MQKTADPLDSRSHSPPSRSVEFLVIKLPAPWRFLTYVYLLSSHSLVPSDFNDSPYGKQQSTAIHTHRLPSLEKRCSTPPCTENSPASATTIAASKQAHTIRNACHPPRNRQLRRRPVQPPGLNTRVCLDFVCITFLQ